MDPAASEAPRRAPVLLVIAGPAGSGKTTLCERMVREVPGVSRVVTATTRPPREGEINGVHYHFPVSPSENLMPNCGGRMRFSSGHWCTRRHRYGTLASSVREPLARGQSLVINVDVQGVDAFRRGGRQ
jgi:guanylate kinase